MDTPDVAMATTPQILDSVPNGDTVDNQDYEASTTINTAEQHEDATTDPPRDVTTTEDTVQQGATASTDPKDDSFVDLTLDDLTTIDLQPSSPAENLSKDDLCEDIKKSPGPREVPTCEKSKPVVKPLRAEEVRWFYIKNSGKSSKLKPMRGNDSLRLELAYRAYKKCPFTNKANVSIRGGLFEADVETLTCSPIYWSNSNDAGETVIRGTWFFDNWLPIFPENSEIIEREHQARWKGYDINLIQELVGNEVMHSVKLKDCHVEWKSVTNVMLYKDATVNRAIRQIGQKIGMGNGYKLHRGYKVNADLLDKLPPVGNLMLVVHGIGSRQDRLKIVRNTNDFRALCRKFEKDSRLSTRSVYIPVEWRSRLKLNEEQVRSITPHKSITIRRFLHTTALDIMYYTSPLYRDELVDGLKQELNRLYDKFIEHNPDFDGKVNIFAHSLGNIVFHDILTNWQPGNPIKTSKSPNQSPPNSPRQSPPRSPRQSLPGSPKRSPTSVKKNLVSRSNNCDERPKGLNFNPHFLFALGSPLGIFFCLRGYTPDGSDDKILPFPCRRIYNIYHPADPCAYRLEPLIYEHYSHVKPVQVDSAYNSSVSKENSAMTIERNASDMVMSGDEELSKENSASFDNLDERNNLSDLPTAKPSYLRSMAGGAVRFGSRLFSRSIPSPTNQVNKTSETPSPRPTSPCELVTPETLQIFQAIPPSIEENDLEPTQHNILPCRIDYVLQESFTESKLGYAALTSHCSYWRNQDLAKFVTEVLKDGSSSQPPTPSCSPTLNTCRKTFNNDSEVQSSSPTSSDVESFI